MISPQLFGLIASVIGIFIITLVVILVSPKAKKPEEKKAAPPSQSVSLNSPTDSLIKVDPNGNLSTLNINNFLPSGTIIMFYSKAIAGQVNYSAADIPAGWVVCNGENGTPDLRDRVPVGGGLVGNVYGAKGGSWDHTITTEHLPSHDHKFRNAYSKGVVTASKDNGWPSGVGTIFMDMSDPVEHGQAKAINKGTTGWSQKFEKDDTLTTQATGDGKPMRIVSPFTIVLFLMKL
jgi:hypothetical protein